MQRPAPQGLVCLAVITTAHGVRGALKLRCFTEEPENVAAYGPLCDEHGHELFELEIVGRTKGGVIVRARGIDDRDAAEALRGTHLYVPRERLPEPDEDEFYVEDLAGLEAVSPSGEVRGKVLGVFNFGAGDVVEIVTPEGRPLLVPFTREAVPEVDLAARRMVVDPPAESARGGEEA
ncbi:ribosome maturation factor RimM [Marinimicrococcus flavescens]|uniref:Ribosome maturation factor RimM n=1 Tax=Marinimicrococcus flavescens TaxID=3031815 RepID=A0AAP3XSE4_9PROT|nr:ribosome maturation factor RimM [Marinimicrococcus flavescens]MDF1587149.1 ribosome maturation factor RimM [Marinimicrococcus flavescens]